MKKCMKVGVSKEDAPCILKLIVDDNLIATSLR